MLSRKKNQNIVLSLRNREQSPRYAPYRISLNILGSLIYSENTSYQQVWNRKSNSPIIYDAGHFYFNNYTSCYTLYGQNSKPSLSHFLKQSNAKAKIMDVISYTTPVYRNMLEEHTDPNISLSRYLLCVTKDNWFCQYNWDSGILMNEIYVKPFGENLSFLHCDWNTYSKQIVLTSGVNPKGKKDYFDNVVVVLAVFTTHPIEFYAMFDIKRSVFGRHCRHVNVSDQMLILGMGQHVVHMYNFNEVLKGGTLHPYKIGEKYSFHGKVGTYPMGIPCNLFVDSAPPLLFNVMGYDQTIDFGGFPFHYIHLKKYEDTYYIVKTLTESTAAKNGCIKSSLWLSDHGYAVTFHPDGSNRIIHRTTHYVHCYQIINNSSTTELKKIHTMGFPESSVESAPAYSAYGRRLTRRLILGEYEKYVLATDYEDELELFGILGISPGDSTSTGFVKLYNSITGKEVKCINLEKTLSDTNRYELHVDLDSIIITEKDLSNNFYVFLYQLHS